MNAAPQTLERLDLFRIADELDAALNVIRRHGGGKTTLDVYTTSVLSTLRRSILQQARDAVDHSDSAQLAC